MEKRRRVLARKLVRLRKREDGLVAGLHEQTREILDEMMHAREAANDYAANLDRLSYVKAERHERNCARRLKKLGGGVNGAGGTAAQQLADADTELRAISARLLKALLRKQKLSEMLEDKRAEGTLCAAAAKVLARVVPVAREKNPTELIDEEKRAREEAAARAAKIAEMELEAEREELRPRLGGGADDDDGDAGGGDAGAGDAGAGDAGAGGGRRRGEGAAAEESRRRRRTTARARGAVDDRHREEPHRRESRAAHGGHVAPERGVADAQAHRRGRVDRARARPHRGARARALPAAAQRARPRSAGAAAIWTRPRSTASARRPGGAPQLEASAGKSNKAKGRRRSSQRGGFDDEFSPSKAEAAALSAGAAAARPTPRASAPSGTRAPTAGASCSSVQDVALHVLRALRTGHGEAGRHQAVRRGRYDVAKRGEGRRARARGRQGRRRGAARGGRAPLPDRVRARGLRSRARAPPRGLPAPHRAVPPRRLRRARAPDEQEEHEKSGECTSKWCELRKKVDPWKTLVVAGTAAAEQLDDDALPPWKRPAPCRNGCGVAVTPEGMAAHAPVCAMRLVPCRHTDCNARVPLAKMKEHETSGECKSKWAEMRKKVTDWCMFAPDGKTINVFKKEEPCGYGCGAMVTVRNRAEHLTTVCPYREVRCRHPDCKAVMRHIDVARHEAVDCKAVFAGCGGQSGTTKMQASALPARSPRAETAGARRPRELGRKTAGPLATRTLGKPAIGSLGQSETGVGSVPPRRPPPRARARTSVGAAGSTWSACTCRPGSSRPSAC